MDCVANETIPQLYCGFLVRDLKGDILFGTDTNIAKPKDIVVLRAFALAIGAGSFFVSICGLLLVIISSRVP